MADSDTPSPLPLADEPFHPEVLSSEVVYSGVVWDIRREVFRYNNAPVTREFVDHTGAVAVLAMDDHDRVLVIQQYRHPVRHRDAEIPAGLLDIDGEEPLSAAQRELAEETDLQAARWNVLVDLFTSPGGSNEAIRIYLARSVSPVVHAYQREEEEADIRTRWVPLDEAVAAVLDGTVHNAPLIAAVLAAHASRATNWSSLRAPDSPWPTHPAANRSA